LSWRSATGLKFSNDGRTLQIGNPTGGTTRFEGADWTMVQLQFHSGSETRVNGEQFALELQVMHENQQGSKLVLSVLFAKGAANGWLDSLGWSKRLPAAQQELPIDGAVSILDVLPTARQYYAYMGSLTTPPCTEGVQWVVMRERVSISEAQLGAFPTKGNFRPPQALNGRSVAFLSDAPSASESVSSWDYSTQDRWGEAFPACKGSSQSPINIDAALAIRRFHNLLQVAVRAVTMCTSAHSVHTLLARVAGFGIAYVVCRPATRRAAARGQCSTTGRLI
jgi:carbonic anhydrase